MAHSLTFMKSTLKCHLISDFFSRPLCKTVFSSPPYYLYPSLLFYVACVAYYLMCWSYLPASIHWNIAYRRVQMSVYLVECYIQSIHKYARHTVDAQQIFAEWICWTICRNIIREFQRQEVKVSKTGRMRIDLSCLYIKKPFKLYYLILYIAFILYWIYKNTK